MARIGVEESLTDIKQQLQEQGHEVVDLRQEQDSSGCDCCVISGQDQNMMNMQNTQMQGSVINAHGYDSNEVCQQVEERISTS
ncbi:YkuS family protein [Salibacterium aidingense]|uniref:YkuS family protein n=1 Tax=Salibacterium aidingense TaxID=384933 RepID=UPI0003F9C092|nr:YkuS family protein [Salibacterium aidingense]